MLGDPAATGLMRNSPDFWVMVAALAAFVAKEGAGKLPVQVLPCKSSSKALTQVHIAQLRVKVAALAAFVAQEGAGKLPLQVPRFPCMLSALSRQCLWAHAHFVLLAGGGACAERPLWPTRVKGSFSCSCPTHRAGPASCAALSEGGTSWCSQPADLLRECAP